MGDTTYTDNYQVKLVGTGREASSWGESTNENLQRLEASIGGTTSIDIQAMPTGSTNAVSAAWTATWITIDSADNSTAEQGAEGRSRFVEVTDSGSIGGNPTLEIRGSSSGEVPARVYFIKNALTTHDLIIDAGTTLFTLRNGLYAVVVTVPVTVGGVADGVHNILDSLQLGGVSFDSAAAMTFTGGSNVMTVPNAEAAALTITDGTDDYLRIDSVLNRVEALSDISSSDFGSFTWDINSSHANAFQVNAGGTNYINIDTVDGEIDFDSPINISTTQISSVDQSTVWTMRSNSANALRFDVTISGDQPFKIQTSSGAERIHLDFPVKIGDGSLRLDDPAAFIQFDGDTGLTASGYGVRTNSGSMESKSSGGDWAAILTSLAPVISAATSTGPSGENKDLQFDIGPIRVVIDTILVGTTTTTPITVSGMAANVYAVFACQSELNGNSGNVAAWVTGSATRAIAIRNNGGTPSEITYIAFGDV